jgi:hypothetical protein
VRTVKAAKTHTRLLMLSLLAGIVLGILGMHAFVQCGAMPMHGTDARPATVTANADMAMEHTAAAPKPSPLGTPKANVQHPGSPMGDMVMLCGAMLLVAASGVLLALRLRRLAWSRGISVGRLRPVIANRLAARVEIGPPYVWEFSVVRC